MYDIEKDIENVAIVLHNGHGCMSWKEAQVLARAALNASTAVKSHQLLVEALKRTYSAISHLREMKQPTKAMIAKWCDDGDKVIGAALKAARGE